MKRILYNINTLEEANAWCMRRKNSYKSLHIKCSEKIINNIKTQEPYQSIIEFSNKILSYIYNL